MSYGTDAFRQAAPIWFDGPRPPRHDILGLTASADIGADGKLRIACCSAYRAWSNGNFLGAGPARAGRGTFRIDEWAIPPGTNVVAIEVVHYGANGYIQIDQPAFVCAEVLDDRGVVAATDGVGFQAHEVVGRRRKVARISYQRPFSEAYELAPGWTDWRAGHATSKVLVVDVGDRRFLKGPAPLPSFSVRAPAQVISRGKWTAADGVELRRDWSLTTIGPHLEGYPEQELEVAPMLEWQKYTVQHVASEMSLGSEPIDLGALESVTLDYSINGTGLVGARLQCEEPVRLYVAHDEILTSGRVDPNRLGCVAVLRLDLEPGTYEFESFEPYTFRYQEWFVAAGRCKVIGSHVREWVTPSADNVQFACSDHRLNQVFRASMETFRSNAVDIFMDCPSRERAGWLCDSYFTARAAAVLTGSTAIERSFLENFALADEFPALPEGMIPMCYPSDHPSGTFIPQWAMWCVVQTAEYQQRSGDRTLVKLLEPRLAALMGFLQKHENEFGLLEKLPSWNFIEWSKANEWTQDVNYPTNMLYAGCLDAYAALYGDEEKANKAMAVRQAVHKQSYDGRFYVDNATRQEGKLVPTTNRSEACQYYAFFFGVAAPATQSELWQTLVTDFGPTRKETKLHPEVAFANAFIGMVLRIELLARNGRAAQVCSELVGYYHQMALLTGTLWENDSTVASCNHGFASCVARWLIENAAGLQATNESLTEWTAKTPDNGLDWAQVKIPCANGFLESDWTRGGSLRASGPPGVVLKLE